MTQPDELPTETADLVARLNKLVHCIGQKCNPIKKEAARTITRQVERIAELEEAHKAALDLAWKRDGQLVAATARIAELERALADETEACAKLAEAFSPAALIVHDIRIGIYPKQSMPGVAIAAAIRARAALASVQSSTTGASDE